MHPSFSIIIPVYNASSWIGDALNSILKQDYREVEILCMDDASTDDSVQAICLIAERDSRVRLFSSIRNEGAGARRNEGIQHARGEWILFLDADDWYEEGLFLRLAGVIVRNPDINIIEFEFFITDPHGTKKRAEWLNRGEEGVKLVEKENILSCTSTCNKCWRREFLVKWGLSFAVTNQSGEEVPLHICAFLVAERFYYLPFKGYCWRYCPDSCSRSEKKETVFLEGIFDMLQVLRKELVRLRLFHEEYYRLACLVILSWSLQEKKSSRKTYGIYYRSVREWFLKNGISRRVFNKYGYGGLYKCYKKLEKTPWPLFRIKMMLKYMLTINK